MATSSKQVGDFLNEFKSLVVQKRFHFTRRLEKNKTIVSLGLTKANATQELLTLSVIHYSAGPLPDCEMPDEDCWIFGKAIHDCEAYIKLKLYTVNGIQYAKCISFHQADHAMQHPFRA